MRHDCVQEKRLVAQVNAVAVLDMIKDLQDEIKVTINIFAFFPKQSPPGYQ